MHSTVTAKNESSNIPPPEVMAVMMLSVDCGAAPPISLTTNSLSENSGVYANGSVSLLL